MKRNLDPEKTRARMERYLESHKRVLITGLSEQEYNNFVSLPGDTFKEKLLQLMNIPTSQPDNKPLISIPEIKQGIQDTLFYNENPLRQTIEKALSEDQDFQGYKKQVQKILIKISELKQEVMSKDPKYESKKNIEYWQKRKDNEEIKKAFEILNRVNNDMEKLITEFYVSVTANEVINLSKKDRIEMLQEIKKLLKIGSFQK